MLKSGQQTGRYKILSLLGTGGMGEVFLAEDTRLGRKVCLKILPESVASDKDRLLRFEREAQTASALNHPNIITIHEIGELEDRMFIATEFIDGETLGKKIEKNELSVYESVKIAEQVAAALSVAHQAYIIHRDIKPENIMIRRDGIVKVLDFGLAKLIEKKVVNSDAEAETSVLVRTKTGVIMGTVSYMSPEQARGKETDARTDIFSLGIVLYEILTGHLPFAGETISDKIAAILMTEPKKPRLLNPKIPFELEQAVLKTLCKDCDERYQTVEDLLTDLQSLKKRLEFEAEPKLTNSANKWSEVNTQVLELKATVQAKTHNSIAVLPFSNISADAENEYFCDGLAEELLNALSKIGELKVVARTSAFSFKGKSTDINEIGKTLNVATILEGSVRKSGNYLRITAQLIDASNGYHLWSERYDREMKDIFDLQDEITLKVVDALKIKLLGKEKVAIMKRYTDNTEVYELYLKGRFCLNHDYLNSGTQNDLQRAINYFQQVIVISPDYAPAFSGLADAYRRLSFSGDAPPPLAETMSKAREAAQKALSLDNDLSEAHAALGSILFIYDFDFAGGEREYKLAIRLNPNQATVHEGYAGLLIALGRHEEADAEFQRALEIDPLSLNIKMKYCQSLILSRKYEESLAQLKEITELNSNLPLAKISLAAIYEAKGSYAEAIEEIAKLQELYGVPEHAGLIRESFAKGGWQGFLQDRMLLAIQQPNLPSTTKAMLYATVGEKDKAFAELDKAYESREKGLIDLKVDPSFDPLRDDPRFQDLLRRVGLPQ